MNFYQRHIGDWVTATAHLTEVEECIYSRLIDQYYARESVLPLEIEKVCRLVRASSKESRKAVATVLEEFFEKTDDGWHQKRCDAEIAKFKEEEPLRIQKEENIKERKRRFNERRKHMFEALRVVDIVPSWDVKMTELERLFKQHIDAPRTQTGTSEERPTDENGTTNQYPIPNTQEPSVKDKSAAKSPRPSKKCPNNFLITDEMREWCTEYSITVDLRTETEKFKDYTFKNAITDWHGAWRNWMRRAQDIANSKPKTGGANGKYAAASRAIFEDESEPNSIKHMGDVINV